MLFLCLLMKALLYIMKESMRVTKCLDVKESAAVHSNPPTIRPEVASCASRYLGGYLDNSNVSVKKLFFPLFDVFLFPFIQLHYVSFS
jgi:hypothetical protein